MARPWPGHGQAWPAAGGRPAAAGRRGRTAGSGRPADGKVYPGLVMPNTLLAKKGYLSGLTVGLMLATGPKNIQYTQHQLIGVRSKTAGA